jgi:acetyltransferase
MIEKGREIILGVSRDPQFGPLVMFGLGGIYVEVMKDVSFRIAPFSVEDADDMIKEIRSYPLLRGVRGEKSVDMAALRDSVLRLSQLVTDYPEIVEMDINPLVLFPGKKGSMAIDVRITIKEEEKS